MWPPRGLMWLDEWLGPISVAPTLSYTTVYDTNPATKQFSYALVTWVFEYVLHLSSPEGELPDSYSTENQSNCMHKEKLTLSMDLPLLYPVSIKLCLTFQNPLESYYYIMVFLWLNLGDKTLIFQGATEAGAGYMQTHYLLSFPGSVRSRVGGFLR